MHQNVQQHHQNQNQIGNQNQIHSQIAAQNVINQSGVKMPNSNQYHVNAQQRQFAPTTNTVPINQTQHQNWNQPQALPIKTSIPLNMRMNEVKMMKMNNGTVNFINTNDASQSTLPLKATVVTTQSQPQTVTVGCVPVPVQVPLPIQPIPVQKLLLFYTRSSPDYITFIPSFFIK